MLTVLQRDYPENRYWGLLPSSTYCHVLYWLCHLFLNAPDPFIHLQILSRQILIHLCTHSTNIYWASYTCQAFSNSLYLILLLIFTKLFSLLLSCNIPHSVTSISVCTRSQHHARHHKKYKWEASPVPAIKDLSLHRLVNDQLTNYRKKEKQAKIDWAL